MLPTSFSSKMFLSSRLRLIWTKYSFQSLFIVKQSEKACLVLSLEIGTVFVEIHSGQFEFRSLNFDSLSIVLIMLLMYLKIKLDRSKLMKESFQRGKIVFTILCSSGLPIIFMKYIVKLCLLMSVGLYCKSEESALGSHAKRSSS